MTRSGLAKLVSGLALGVALLAVGGLLLLNLGLRGFMSARDVDLVRAREVVEMVRSGSIDTPATTPGATYQLPPEYADLSLGGEISVTRDSSTGVFMVEFWTRLGIGSSAAVVYLENPQGANVMTDGARVSEIAPNWYNVET